MLELAEARRRILETVLPLGIESVSLDCAHGRFLAEKIIAEIDLPGFDNSAVDGYALRSKDTILAKSEAPTALQLIGKIPAGEFFSGKIGPGQCARIFTGSPLPDGADAVAMQEDTRIDAQNSSRILFLDSVKPWENVRFQGEDFKKGSTLGDCGLRLSTGQLSLLAAAGVSKVNVSRQPIIGLLASGSELREANQPISRGQIYESNRVGLAVLAKQCGAIPKIYPLVSDNLEATIDALKMTFAECDAVVTTGGVSVGELDFVKSAFEKLGGNVEFWKVAIKPGKPFVFGRLGDKLLFGLPGNPVSALVTFILFAAPALLRMQGATDISWPRQSATLAEPLKNPGERRHFMRVFVDDNGQAKSTGMQSSHILSAFAKANGLVDVPPNTTVPTGAIVPVMRLD